MMPILQSSVRQDSSQKSPSRVPRATASSRRTASTNSRRKNTVLPPSGMTRTFACTSRRLWNHLKYSRQFAARHQAEACTAHHRRSRRRRCAPSRGLGGSGTRRGSELKFISATPAWTMPEPVTRNRWSTIRSTSGWSRSSASSTPTQSHSQIPIASRSCSARLRPIGLLWTSVSSG